EEVLHQVQEELEIRFQQRTGELAKANAALEAEIARGQQAAEALRESEAKYHDLYDNAPDLMGSSEADTWTLDECNQTLARELGYAKEEILGRSVFDLYHPNCLPAARQVVGAFVQHGEVHDAQLDLRRKDGSKLAVSLNMSALRGPDGRIL